MQIYRHTHCNNHLTLLSVKLLGLKADTVSNNPSLWDLAYPFCSYKQKSALGPETFPVRLTSETHQPDENVLMLQLEKAKAKLLLVKGG